MLGEFYLGSLEHHEYVSKIDINNIAVIWFCSSFTGKYHTISAMVTTIDHGKLYITIKNIMDVPIEMYDCLMGIKYGDDTISILPLMYETPITHHYVATTLTHHYVETTFDLYINLEHTNNDPISIPSIQI